MIGRGAVKNLTETILNIINFPSLFRENHMDVNLK